MNLQITMPDGRYKSKCQIVRVCTEDWIAKNAYCPACESRHLSQEVANSPAVDFKCLTCREAFELKSCLYWNVKKIVDAGYASMVNAIRSDTRPSLFLLNYTPNWKVQHLLVIPRFVFAEKAIERRKPLAATARRAGWIGCNILLNEIPSDGKVWMVNSGVQRPPAEVRNDFNKLRQLGSLDVEIRGWTLEVLKAVRKLGKSEFALHEVYGLIPDLADKYPKNQNVRAKLRQQLQVLRDMGVLSFTGAGHYKLKG